MKCGGVYKYIAVKHGYVFDISICYYIKPFGIINTENKMIFHDKKRCTEEHCEYENIFFSEKEMALLRAGELRFVFLQPHLVSDLTLFEDVAVAGYACKRKDVRAVWKRAAFQVFMVLVRE